jgi:basic amino acid/polyamine antiporter, APA family
MGSARPLRRILGLGFGLAFTFGTMVGVGILRLPGTVAAAAASPTLIIISWCVGALYALMGAVSVSELAAMYPEAISLPRSCPLPPRRRSCFPAEAPR